MLEVVGQEIGGQHRVQTEVLEAAVLEPLGTEVIHQFIWGQMLEPMA